MFESNIHGFFHFATYIHLCHLTNNNVTEILRNIEVLEIFKWIRPNCALIVTGLYYSVITINVTDNIIILIRITEHPMAMNST